MRKYSVDVALPVYYGNSGLIEKSVKKQIECFNKLLKNYNWRITLSINGPKAGDVIALSKRLAKQNPKVKWLYTKNAGKGYGVINTWQKSKADVLAYMDIDLSTDPNSIKELIEPIIYEGYDIVLGSRYHPKTMLKRGLKRLIISKVYHRFLVNFILGVRFSDTQCGFKAISQKAAQELIKKVRDRVWFFETELVYIAQKEGYRIKEIPVVWTESEESGIKLSKVVPSFIKKVVELKFRKT